MTTSRFYTQLQQQISRWLNYGKKSGFTELELEKIILGSSLGKRSENQDRVLFFRVRFEESRKPAFAGIVLCDGMGGMASGGDCATLAISTFATSLARSNASSALTDKLRVAVKYTNEVVYKAYQGKGGATLSAVVCDEKDKWAAINVGDSRIYQVFDTGIVEQLTIDDTLENQLVNLNLPSPPPEFRQLLQYIGMGEGVEPRVIDLQPSSEVNWIVITSDGAHSLPKEIFQAVIVHAETSKNAVDRLIAISEWLGGKDNSTVAVLPLGKKLLIREQDSSSGYFEIWGIPGKAEFLSIIQDETRGIRNLTTLDKETTKDEGVAKKERNLSPKRQAKQKKQKDFEETALNDANGNKGNGEKIAPQLNIEFSQED
ncbi:protein phosphatase 2C domain-containing protein [Microcoleus sp. FACHB-68]|uniref:PP2C family protein-serine/threonine phosphatase n=1 Tax=Microcoleus sp. FACHB-68 TaxID=2692826 RepID=UPI001683D1D4|nr:protein phosphatase 2C domain-containing protein [Microcoleus sp. FACHB-68]MBD1937375.1 protein phosphatase 2C domain-containing protein [Microcoleus sp. FACHB-68]